MSFVKSVLQSVLSLDLTTVLVFLFVLLVTYQVFKMVTGPKLPPGPPRLPIVGSTPFVDSKTVFWQETQRLSKKYNSDILTLDVYGRLVILLQSYETAKEAFQKRDDMADRAPKNFFKAMEPSYQGILSSSGVIWKEQRRFALFMLRDFGMGKIAAERSIQEEAIQLCERLEEVSLAENGVDPLYVLEPAVSNIICALAFGKRFEYTDKEFNASLGALNYMVGNFSSAYSRLELSPSLSWLVPILYSKVNREMKKQYALWSDFIRKIIQEHREKFDGSVNDVIDGFFAEQQKRINDKDSSFTEPQLRHLIQDLFLAGSETTTTTLRWALLFLLKYPHIEEKIHDELVNVIGERVPCMGDKKNTPYTEAFLLEIQRFNTIVPNAVAHSTPVDLEFRGYTIPAGAFVISNLAAIHRDERVFDDPDTFQVDRFLDGGKVVNADKVNQFGIGRRVCAGEALARMEIYIFFVAIVLKFKLTPVAKEVDLVANSAAINGPKPYKLRASRRVQS